MSLFENETALRRALETAGLADLADPVVETARGTLVFLRRPLPDDSLPPGTGKVGGLPDLPEAFGWPVRPARPDAAALEAGLRRQAEARRALRERLRAMPSLRQPPGDDGAFEAAEERHAALLAESFARPFPLAFVAQLDLGPLSRVPGFDPDLPAQGLLSIFEDVTGSGGEVRVFWHREAPAGTARQPPPAELVTLSDASPMGRPWSALTDAEVLDPHAALTIPHGWIAAAGTRRQAMADLLDISPASFMPRPPEGDRSGASFFGDQLGGWPVRGPAGPRAPDASGPGDERTRHLFSWSGEHFGNTRLFQGRMSDGTTCLTLAREALLARRFDAVRAGHRSE